MAPGKPAPAVAPVVAPNSIAVLPFENLSADAAQSYFSDGMTEELRSALAGVAGLQVAARTSSNAFRGTAADAATNPLVYMPFLEAGVDVIATDNVRSSAEAVRMFNTARLRRR